MGQQRKAVCAKESAQAVNISDCGIGFMSATAARDITHRNTTTCAAEFGRPNAISLRNVRAGADVGKSCAQ